MAKSMGVYLSYILRHSPETLDLDMDDQGWVSVSDLLARATHRKKPISEEDLIEEVAKDEKGRFQFNADKTLIRCVQGHSVPHVILHAAPYTVPQDLYHGTAAKNIESIFEHGLQSLSRTQVHLSRDIDTAFAVGKRHGSPVVFIVDTRAMLADGIKLSVADNGVVLTDSVPAKYLTLRD